MSNTWLVATIAGYVKSGFRDGHSFNARFASPIGICLDQMSHLYITDSQNHNIRKICNHQVTTIAGNGEKGFRDGNALNAMFKYPQGICISHDEKLYVTDSGNHRIRMIYHNQVTTIAGNGTKGFRDGASIDAMFKSPQGICLSQNGNLYVTDCLNHAIRKIHDGQVTTLAGNGQEGCRNGHSNNATFYYPRGICVSKDEKIYIADSCNHRIRMIDNNQVTTLAGNGNQGFHDGHSNTAILNYPNGICLSYDGKIYVTDDYNNRIRRIHDGQVETIVGCDEEGFRNGNSTHAMFYSPDGICITPDGNLCVVDSFNNSIRLVYTSQSITSHLNASHCLFSFANVLHTMSLLDYEITINMISYKLNRKFIAVRCPSLLDDNRLKMIEASTISNKTIDSFIMSYLHTDKIDYPWIIQSQTNNSFYTMQQILFPSNIDSGEHESQKKYLEACSRPLFVLAKLAYQQTSLGEKKHVMTIKETEMVATTQKLTLHYNSESLMHWCKPDFVIMLSNDDTVYHVHKFILCGRWRYFAFMLQCGLQEAQENKMVLPDDWTRSRLQKWMAYIYLDEIDFHDVDDIVWLITHARLYTIATFKNDTTTQLLSEDHDQTSDMIACEGFELLYDHCMSLLNDPMTLDNCITKYLLFKQLNFTSRIETASHFIITHFENIVSMTSIRDEMKEKLDRETIVTFLLKKYQLE